MLFEIWVLGFRIDSHKLKNQVNGTKSSLLILI